MITIKIEAFKDTIGIVTITNEHQRYETIQI